MSPEYMSRINYFSPHYIEIALQNYYIASKCFKKLEELKFYSGESIEEKRKMNSCIIISVVFSSMCIESFFNNYAASHLGDDFFYDNFDTLSIISKFQFISKFILRADIDKSRSYFSFLKKLLKNRNSFVHNKSTEFEISGIHSNPPSEFESYNHDEYPLNLNEYKKDISTALDGLKSVREIALYFDEHDESSKSLQILFNPNYCDFAYGDDYYKKIVLKELDIL